MRNLSPNVVTMQTQLNSKLGLTWKRLSTSPTTTTTTTANSMSAKSPLLLARFWWNFKGSFLGASRTDSNYQVSICPGNISPGDNCPYQGYLSCYWVWAVPSSGNSYDWFDFHFWRADCPILVCQSYLFTKDNLQGKTALVYESFF